MRLNPSNPGSSQLLYSTYLGTPAGGKGSKVDALAVDPSGNIWVSGITNSNVFPVTADAAQPAFGGGGYDAFLARIDAAGPLGYATYLGGSGDDGTILLLDLIGTPYNQGLALDPAGNVYMAGQTKSTNFPVLNAYQPALSGTTWDGFVAKFTPAGAKVYATYLGGASSDPIFDLAVDAAGAAYVTGMTQSTNFPTVNPAQGTRSGSSDAFITKIDPSGSSLHYSTYWGGSGNEYGSGIAVDGSGCAYVVGAAASGFPLVNAAQTMYGGGTTDGFVLKLSPTGNAALYSTYLGGSGNDILSGIAVNNRGDAIAGGCSKSANYPTTGSAYKTTLSGTINCILSILTEAPVATAPTAAFTANVTNGTAPLAVAFTDNSTGDAITARAWDFQNDGVVDSTEQNPTYTYAAVGTYTVNLTVTNAGSSDSEVKTAYVQVSPRLPKTWTVGASGCDFTTVMDALNSASVVNGDTIYVYNGTYSFTGLLKSINLTGEGADLVTLDLGGPATVRKITGSGTIIEQMRFTNGRLQFPTMAPAASNMIVRNCTFEGMASTPSPYQAINVVGSNNVFQNNTFKNNNAVAIVFTIGSCTGTCLENNTFTTTTSTYSTKGVIEYSGTTVNSIIRNNIFTDNAMPCILSMAGISTGNCVYLNDFIVPDGYAPIQKTGTNTIPAISWVTSATVPYTYQGTSHTGTLGNYYSTYIGTDANGDGIGDTPYDLLIQNQVDTAPLMAPVENYFGGSSGPAAPDAAFSANVTNGTAPLAVAFTDNSTGDAITARVWDFTNDGTVDSTEQNPTYTYAAAGNYTVNLTVTNAGGSDSEVKTDYITVTEPATPTPTPTVNETPTATPTVNETPTVTPTVTPVTGVMPASRDVNLLVSNAAGARFDDYGNDTYNFFNTGQSATQGLNALHITTDPVATEYGQVTASGSQSGTFYLSDTGGRGWDDDGVLLLAVNGTVPDDFRVRIRAGGYTWTPVPTGSYPTFAGVTYNAAALDETFTKDDFLYGPQTWRPCAGANNYYPIFNSQNMADAANTFSIAIVDLNAGILGGGTRGQASFAGQTLSNNGAIRVDYTLENLETFAAFDAYAYTVSSNQGQGIRWTNRLSEAGASGFSVTGVAPPPAPVAEFAANVTNGTAPLTVAFTDNSTGENITARAWDFQNDGVVDSLLENPTFTYTTAGTYPVNLTVTNGGGSDSEVKTGYITVTEPATPTVTPTVNETPTVTPTLTPIPGGPLPDYNNIFVGVANDAGPKYDAFGNDSYNIRFEGYDRGLNALHVSTDPAVNFGQVTTTASQSGTFYATDSGGKGYEDEILLLVAVNGTVPDDFRLHVTADGYTWTPNPIPNQAPTSSTYSAATLDETFTKADLVYGPQTWKPTGNGFDYPISFGQDMGDAANTFKFMFVDLNAGVLRPNAALENMGAVRINYSFENLDTFASFSVYGYCKTSNNGNDMVAWTNSLLAAKAPSGYAVTAPSAPTPTVTPTVNETPTVTPTVTATPTVTPTTPAVVQVPNGTGLPTDTNGDELYDDVNGNGRKDFADVILYFNQMTWIAANEPIAAFDCNGNGRIDFGDLVWFFNHL
ncbi:MAG: PKD domain-containing protein [Methanospirillum sp.]